MCVFHLVNIYKMANAGMFVLKRLNRIRRIVKVRSEEIAQPNLLRTTSQISCQALTLSNVYMVCPRFFELQN